MVRKRKRYKTSAEKREDEDKRKRDADEFPPPKRRYILTRKTRLGSSYEQTVAGKYATSLDEDGSEVDEVSPDAIEKMKKLHKGEIKSVFYSPKARREYHFQTKTMQRLKIRAWFDDPSVKTVLKEHAEILYGALLARIQGRRPEYLMTVVLDIIYFTHDEWMEPASFVENFNPETYFKNYYLVWDIIREKNLRSIRTPGGIIELKFKRRKKPKK